MEHCPNLGWLPPSPWKLEYFICSNVIAPLYSSTSFNTYFNIRGGGGDAQNVALDLGIFLDVDLKREEVIVRKGSGK